MCVCVSLNLILYDLLQLVGFYCDDIFMNLAMYRFSVPMHVITSLHSIAMFGNLQSYK